MTLADQKKHLVDHYYKLVEREYDLRPSTIDYGQFEVDADQTLYWTPGNKKISITATRGGFEFRALSTLTGGEYGRGGVNAVRRSLRLTGYASKTPRLIGSVANIIRQEGEASPSPASIENA